MPQSEATSNKKEKSLFKNPFFLAAVAGMIILPLIRMLAMARRDAPPPLTQISPWALSDEKGHQFFSKSLKGKIVLLHLYYPGCTGACKKSFDTLQEVRKRFSHVADSVRTISFSVVSENNIQTAEIFYRAHPATQKDWIFLHGTISQLQDVLIDNFKMVDVLMNKQGQPGVGIDSKASPSQVLKRLADAGYLYFLDQNGDLRLAIEADSASLAGMVRAGLFLLEKGPDA